MAARSGSGLPEVGPDDALLVAPWDAGGYRAHHGDHRGHDEWFVAVAALHLTDRILEVGRGGGVFTRRLADADVNLGPWIRQPAPVESWATIGPI